MKRLMESWRAEKRSEWNTYGPSPRKLHFNVELFYSESVFVYCHMTDIIEEMILRRVFGPKSKEDGEWRRLQSL